MSFEKAKKICMHFTTNRITLHINRAAKKIMILCKWFQRLKSFKRRSTFGIFHYIMLIMCTKYLRKKEQISWQLFTRFLALLVFFCETSQHWVIFRKTLSLIRWISMVFHIQAAFGFRCFYTQTRIDHYPLYWFSRIDIFIVFRLSCWERSHNTWRKGGLLELCRCTLVGSGKCFESLFIERKVWDLECCKSLYRRLFVICPSQIPSYYISQNNCEKCITLWKIPWNNSTFFS